ncbi:MAG: AraC family transcriptional regulator [Treponema sp.]|nr:AraC family transcriptional regulator [Treponema sp.]
MAETEKNQGLTSKDFPIGIFSSNTYLQETHHHIENEFFYLDKGTAILGLRNNEIEIKAGTVIYIEAGAEHYIRNKNENEPFHYYALVYDTTIVEPKKGPVTGILENIKINTILNMPENLLANLRNTVVLEKNKAFGSLLVLKTVLFEFLSHIVQTNQYQMVSTLYENSRHSVSAVDSAIAYIKEHYRENIDIEDIFNETNYSKSHFSRLFKETSGKSITEYINSYRVEKACLDMIYTDKNITEIAMENGFNNVQYFSRVFKQVMNCSPRQYKKNSFKVEIPSTYTHVN